MVTVEQFIKQELEAAHPGKITVDDVVPNSEGFSVAFHVCFNPHPLSTGFSTENPEWMQALDKLGDVMLEVALDAMPVAGHS